MSKPAGLTMQKVEGALQGTELAWLVHQMQFVTWGGGGGVDTEFCS
jgi:hypothetical protein